MLAAKRGLALPSACELAPTSRGRYGACWTHPRGPRATKLAFLDAPLANYRFDALSGGRRMERVYGSRDERSSAADHSRDRGADLWHEAFEGSRRRPWQCRQELP